MSWLDLWKPTENTPEIINTIIKNWDNCNTPAHREWLAARKDKRKEKRHG